MIDKKIQQPKIVHTHALNNPIQFGEDLISKLEFRELEGRDMDDMPMPPKFGDYLRLAAILTNQTPGFMGKLKRGDPGKVVQLTMGFMDGGQGTGEKS